jgi:hypothetical protein
VAPPTIVVEAPEEDHHEPPRPKPVEKNSETNLSDSPRESDEQDPKSLGSSQAHVTWDEDVDEFYEEKNTGLIDHRTRALSRVDSFMRLIERNNEMIEGRRATDDADRLSEGSYNVEDDEYNSPITSPRMNAEMFRLDEMTNPNELSKEELISLYKQLKETEVNMRRTNKQIQTKLRKYFLEEKVTVSSKFTTIVCRHWFR